MGATWYDEIARMVLSLIKNGIKNGQRIKSGIILRLVSVILECHTLASGLE